jgi:hypothetical protein
LIDYLSLISKKFGKYDFFTQNIKYPCDLSGNFSANSIYKIKIVSFKKLYSIAKCGELLKKGEEVNKKMKDAGFINYNLTFGYLNKLHVVALYNSPAPERVYVGKNHYAQIQLVLSNGRMVLPKMENREFSILDVKKFFEDLHSLYREQIDKSSS